MVERGDDYYAPRAYYTYTPPTAGISGETTSLSYDRNLNHDMNDASWTSSARVKRYTVIGNPGRHVQAQFSCSPDASLYPSHGPFFTFGYNGNYVFDEMTDWYSDVTYWVRAQPVTISLGGGTSPTSGDYLIGQQVTASASYPFRLTPTASGSTPAVQWSLFGGGDPFKSFHIEYTRSQATQTTSAAYYSTGMKVPLDPVADLQAPSLALCFARGTENGTQATVGCQTHLAVPSGALPAEGLDVTVASVPVKVFAPLVTKVSFTDAYVGFDRADQRDGAGIGLKSLSNPPYNYPGIRYSSFVTTPAEFISGNDPGGWAWVQLAIDPSTRVTNDGASESVYYGPDINGAYFTSKLSLDSIFPYTPPVINDPALMEGPTYTSPADGRILFRANGKNADGSANPNPGVAEDHPSSALHGDAASYYVADNFYVWQLYRPPGAGSEFVPLQSFTWQWSANPVWSGTAWTATALKQSHGNDVKNLANVAFPSWTYLAVTDSGYYRFSHGAPQP